MCALVTTCGNFYLRHVTDDMQVLKVTLSHKDDVQGHACMWETRREKDRAVSSFFLEENI